MVARPFRCRRPGGHRQPLAGPHLTLAVFASLLALLDQTKAAVDAVLLVPSFCLLLAAGASLVVQKCRRFPLLAVPLLIIVLVVIGEGFALYQREWWEVTGGSDYLTVGHQIEASITPGARLLGSDRWWWALRSHPYLALNGLWLNWQWQAQRQAQPPQFSELVSETGADYILVNNDVWTNLFTYPQPLREQFRTFLESCTQLVTDWTNETYGRIVIYQLRPGGAC
jgi:hypothetical protein